ncbi:NADPH dehydrogenase NamA [Sulfurospirillum sp. 1307]
MLFENFTTKDITLKNRLVMSPMCMYSAKEDGILTPWHLNHYETRAAGQIGMIMTEATAVSTEGRISNNDLGLWYDEQIYMYKKLSDKIHAHGAKIAVQLAHAGRKSEAKDTPIAPSPIAFKEDFRVPNKMSQSDIDKVKNDFLEATKRAIKADIDIIEIHAAHGYLINQFLSPISNKRDDIYGGNFENRNRLLKEIVSDIRDIFEGPLFVRISADETLKEGNHISQSIKTAKMLKSLGVDLVDVSSGGVAPIAPKFYPGYQSLYAKEIKQKAEIKTGTVGLIQDANFAQFLLEEKFADLIFLGRALLKEPYWAINEANKKGIKLYPKAYERAYL